MLDPALVDALRQMVGAAAVRTNASLADFTTFRVGGAADCLVDVRDAEVLCRVLALASSASLPVTVLGGGSNVLVADAGVRGLVVRVRLTDLSQPSAGVVRAGAGVTMNGLVRWTIGRGCASLEAWAGTPGTVGGAIYGNAHYAGRNIGDLVSRVCVVTRNGGVRELGRDEMAFGYDRSRLQTSGELLLWAEFQVTAGEPEALRATARASLAHRKRTQPLDVPSAGCVFQNPDPARDHVPDGIPWSAGALIDRAGLKGHRIGGALISPVHANFFVNEGRASARDLRALIELARRTVRERFGVELRDEIVTIGEW